jgi:hypothetical protein
MRETNIRRWRLRRGQSFLLLTFLIGAIMVAIASIFIAYALSLSASAYALRASAAAESLAFAGIEDSMLQLTRNGSFTSAGYGLTLNTGNVTVIVASSTPSTGFVTSLAIATVGATTRKLQAVFSENASTYQVNLLSLQIVP